MTGPDEGGGATVGLQPSGTLLASEKDVVEGGWAPTPSYGHHPNLQLPGIREVYLEAAVPVGTSQYYYSNVYGS